MTEDTWQLLLQNARANAPRANSRLTAPQRRSLAIGSSIAAMTHGATPIQAVEIAQIIRGEKYVIGEETLTVIGRLP